MRIRYADSALADLDVIHEYQAAHGPAARAPEVAKRPGVRGVVFPPAPCRGGWRSRRQPQPLPLSSPRKRGSSPSNAAPSTSAGPLLS
jgi:hypothetical protein